MLRTIVILALLLIASAARATTVADIARIEGRGETILKGIGLVVGLDGTGDSGKDLAMARPLAELLKNNGNPVLLDELKNVKTVALVSVTCVIPEGGAREHDTVDVIVAALHSATSLAGGQLYLAPLTGPYDKPENAVVYAVAEGEVTVENAASPRRGRVRKGARVIRDIAPDKLGSTFSIVLRPAFAGWGAASAVASSINQNIYTAKAGQAGLPTVATVIDERTVRIEVPEVERADQAAFVGDVMATPINIALLKLPAQVIYNQASGVILLTGDVEISPAVITHRDLTITTTIPAPEPTPDNPMIKTDRWAALGTGVKNGDRARLQDLLDAFNQLRIPVEEQVAILSMLEKTGKLHARLVVD